MTAAASGTERTPANSVAAKQPMTSAHAASSATMTSRLLNASATVPAMGAHST